MRTLPATLLLFLLFTLGCTRGCMSKTEPTKPATEAQRYPGKPAKDPGNSRAAPQEHPPQGIPAGECDDYCQKLCVDLVKIPCEEPVGRYEAFADLPSCEDRCLDLCEAGRMDHAFDGCLQSVDCDAYLECVQAAKKTSKQGAGGGKGKGKRGEGRAGEDPEPTPEAPEPEMEEAQ